MTRVPVKPRLCDWYRRKNDTFTQQPISGRVDRASATEAVNTGLIPGRVKPKTIKIGIHSFPA